METKELSVEQINKTAVLIGKKVFKKFANELSDNIAILHETKHECILAVDLIEIVLRAMSLVDINVIIKLCSDHKELTGLKLDAGKIFAAYVGHMHENIEEMKNKMMKESMN